MPLDKSGTKSSIGRNVSTLRDEKYPQKQAVAIALSVMRRARAGRAVGGPVPFGAGMPAGGMPAMPAQPGPGQPLPGAPGMPGMPGGMGMPMAGRAEGGPPPEQSLTSYQPTWRDRAAMALRRVTGDNDKMMSPEMDRVVTGITGATGAGARGDSVFDMLPTGVATHGADAVEAGMRGNYPSAVGDAALMMAPKGLSVLGKGLGKALNVGARELGSMGPAEADPFAHLSPEDKASVHGLWDTIDNMRGYPTTPAQRMAETQERLRSGDYMPEAMRRAVPTAGMPEGRSSMAGHDFDGPSSFQGALARRSSLDDLPPPTASQSDRLDGLLAEARAKLVGRAASSEPGSSGIMDDYIRQKNDPGLSDRMWDMASKWRGSPATAEERTASQGAFERARVRGRPTAASGDWPNTDLGSRANMLEDRTQDIGDTARDLDLSGPTGAPPGHINATVPEDFPMGTTGDPNNPDPNWLLTKDTKLMPQDALDSYGSGTKHARGGIARAKGGRTDDDMSFPEMVSSNPKGWGPQGASLDPERPPSPEEIEMAREILRQRDAVGNPDASAADALGRFGGDIIKTPVTAGHSIAEAARDPRPSTITKAGIDTAMIPLLFAGPEQGALREGAAKAMAGMGVAGLGAGLSYDTGMTPRAAMEAFVPSAEAMGLKGRTAAAAELGVSPDSLRNRDDDEINKLVDEKRRLSMQGSAKSAEEDAASKRKVEETKALGEVATKKAAADAEQKRIADAEAAKQAREQATANQKSEAERNLREANTPFKVAYSETAAAIPYATAGIGATLGLGMGAREAGSFNEAAEGLSARSKAATEAAEAALGKSPMKANMNIQLAKKLASEQAGLKTGPKWYKGPAMLGGVGGELGQAAPYVIDYAKAPGRPDAEGNDLHKDTVAAISDPSQVAARVVQGALWGAGPAKIGQGLALLKKRAVPSYLANAEALEAATGAEAPSRFKQMGEATKAATAATPGYVPTPRPARKAAATSAPPNPATAGLDPLSATVQETLAAKAAGAPGPVPTGSGALPPPSPGPSAPAIPGSSAPQRALPPPERPLAPAPTSPSPVAAPPNSTAPGPLMEKKGARLWKHGERNVWRHSPGKSEGGRFTSTPAGVKPPNGDAAEMDENGLWIKPDMPIEDKYKAGGAVGTLLGMARKLRARGGQVIGTRALGHPHVGPVEGPTGGRTDALPISVPHNAYVIPADVVSHYGEGNTAAGMQAMKRMFGGSHTPTGTSMPMGHLSGRADGGGVPIKISDGEFVVSPEEVARRGGGSFDIGNRALDQFVLNSRKAHIDTLSKLPGPAQ